MHTVLELLQLTTDYFFKKQVESPRLNAELLLAHSLLCRRLDLYLMFDKPVQESEINTFREFVKKRGERVPLQYLIGDVEFYGLKFKTTKDALIPRPETELLVEKCLESAKGIPNARILDIGCGTGNILISLCVNLENASGIAIDISDSALLLAAENAAIHLMEDRISFRKKDVLNENCDDLGQFDFIVSNPPYVKQSDYLTLQEEIIKYEPAIAVTDYGDGYTFYRRIITISKDILKTGGTLFFEMAQDQSDTIRELLMENNFSDIVVYRDLQGIERVIKGLKN